MRALALTLCATISACALTEKADIVETRFFAPPAASAPLDAVTASAARPQLQLGAITSASHLKARMVYRSSAVELGVYDDREWTERPEKYLERSLTGRLFGPNMAEQAVGGSGPALEAELLAFEEVRDGAARRGRVTVHFTLHDDQRVWLSDTLTVERTSRSARPEDVVVAIGAALDAVTTELATHVSDVLHSARAPDDDHWHTTGAK